MKPLIFEISAVPISSIPSSVSLVQTVWCLYYQCNRFCFKRHAMPSCFPRAGIRPSRTLWSTLLSAHFIASGTLSSSSPAPPPSPCSLFTSGSFSCNSCRGPRASVWRDNRRENDDKDHPSGNHAWRCNESVYGVESPTPINCQIPPDVMPWVMVMASVIGFRLLVRQKQKKMSVFEVFIVRGRTFPREGLFFLAKKGRDKPSGRCRVYAYCFCKLLFSSFTELSFRTCLSRGAAGQSLLCYDWLVIVNP
ncbi:hypothetical protein GQ457_18G005100 [Hibiscus cannabinus]